VLAELLEAVLGAMVEDGGLDAVRALAHRMITQHRIPTAPPPVDPKSALQMLVQARYSTLPAYRLVERRGPPHQPIFRVMVKVNGEGIEVLVEAEGTTRQAAEQEAARLALQRLNQEGSA
jgi:ribonuclease-3